MNYMGGKYKLLDQLLPLFPADMRVFVDLFTGGLDVALNAPAKSRICVDLNAPVIALYQALQARPENETLSLVEARIDEYALSKTNGDGYRKLRDEYNRTSDPLDLFVLIAHSFNHQARFNSNHKFNTPFGKDRSAFNPTMRANLSAMIARVQAGDFQFVSSDFREVPLAGMAPADFLYADPPYLISSGTYNDGKRGFGGWGPQDDTDLFDLLDALDARGVLFGLSNVVEHKGVVNSALVKWAEKYRVHPLAMSYNNSNYQSRAAGHTTREVLVTNAPEVAAA